MVVFRECLLIVWLYAQSSIAALKKVVKHRQIISKRQMILFSHVRHQLHSHICKKQVMTEVIS